MTNTSGRYAQRVFAGDQFRTIRGKFDGRGSMGRETRAVLTGLNSRTPVLSGTERAKFKAAAVVLTNDHGKQPVIECAGSIPLGIVDLSGERLVPGRPKM